MGIPLKTNRYTKDKSMLRYARLLIEMQIDRDFLEYVEFANERGLLIRQQVKYQWLPLKCSQYRMFSIHRSTAGKKKIKGKNGELELNLSHKS